MQDKTLDSKILHPQTRPPATRAYRSGTRDQNRASRPQRIMSDPMSINRNSVAPSQSPPQTHQPGGIRSRSVVAATLSPMQQRRLKGNSTHNTAHTQNHMDVSNHDDQDHTNDDVLDLHTSSLRRAARELLSGTSRMRSRHAIVDVRYGSSSSSLLDSGHRSADPSRSPASRKGKGNSEKRSSAYDQTPLAPSENDDTMKATYYGSIETGLQEDSPLLGPDLEAPNVTKQIPPTSWISCLIQQISSVAVAALLNIMIAIPFGASYFPVGWSTGDEPSTDMGEDEDDPYGGGPFPLPGKHALGIRMFLFATIMGQLAFTFASGFKNAVGLQMIENVPFLHSLCYIVIRHQGYGMDALSTVFFLFAFGSVVVGATFYFLGKMNLGKVVFYFPNHVLVGCIGGIGVFMIVTAIEVTNNDTFKFDMGGLQSLVEHFNLLLVVLAFESVLVSNPGQTRSR